MDLGGGVSIVEGEFKKLTETVHALDTNLRVLAVKFDDLKELKPAIEKLTDVMQDTLLANKDRDGQITSLFKNDELLRRDQNDLKTLLEAHINTTEGRIDEIEKTTAKLVVKVTGISSVTSAIVVFSLTRFFSGM